MRPTLTILGALLLGSFVSSPAAGADVDPSPLDVSLGREDPARLADEARRSGDPTRGALLFFRASLQCATCHDGGGAEPPLGPDLARLGRDARPEELVEGVLQPSKTVREGYRTVTIATADGKTYTGLLAGEAPEAVRVREPSQGGKTVTIPRASIEERRDGGPSVMPAGLVNQLAARGEFLDLLSYVLDIAAHGPARARALRPPDSVIAPPPVPDYERDVDHAGMIAGLNRASFRRGQAIYDRLCVNCHGNRSAPGSLPNALRFASGAFRNGADPYRMYQTLTHGFGAMAAQSWMVPEQKYDVIHYVREAYLRPFNPSQYVDASKTYLASLPAGHTRGPKPSSIEPWVTMDYGPSLAATYELGSGGANIARKGIAVRLDAGPGGISRGRRWVDFEHDTARVAGAWEGQGFIDWNGINFNGKHEVHPCVSGRVRLANPSGPGWADPRTGRFDDPRPLGRDGFPYGPLPRDRIHYRGLYHHGDRVVISYTVGDAEVLESPGAEPVGPTNDPGGAWALARTFQVGPSRHDLKARLAPASASAVIAGGQGATIGVEEGFRVLRVPASSGSRLLKVLTGEVSQEALRAQSRSSPAPEPLRDLTNGGTRRWAERMTTRAAVGRDDGPFAIDVLTHPEANPWNCRMRFSGLDFLDGGDSLAV
jgi:putative heme-binding domain-containing protein